MNKTKLREYIIDTLVSNMNYDNIGVRDIHPNGFEIETIVNGFVTTFEFKFEVIQYEVFGDEGDDE